jgi:plastocyanin
MRKLWLAGVMIFMLTALPVWAYEGGTVSNGGTIVGEIKFQGDPPAPEKLEINKDQNVCGTSKTSPVLLVASNKGIANAVVSLADITKGKKMEAAKPELDQKECEYVPHVVIFPAGTELAILNSDGITHNVHTFSTANPSFNQAQPKFRKKITAKFDKPEVISVKCDIHGWMSAVIVATDHPYYVATDANGSFKLTDVPEGTYTLSIWHEKLGKMEQKVEVKAGQESKVMIEMAAK